MSSPRRSTRTPKMGHEDSVHVYPAVKKQSREEAELSKKQADRAGRKGRGMKRANTVFEYAGHPETRETVDNPFGSLVGQYVQVWWSKLKKFRHGRIVEYDAFNGYHVVEYDNKERHLHNLSRTKYRVEDAKEDAVPPTKLKRAKVDKAAAAAADDDDEDDGGADTVVPHVAPIVGAAAPAHVPHIDTMEGGKAEVVAISGLDASAHVYVAADKTVYEATMALIDISKNMDKFYVVQVVESEDKSKYWAVQHWGRTGTKGQCKVDGPSSLQEAIDVVEAKFLEKTGIAFGDRETADAVDGKYKFKLKKYDDDSAKQVMWQYYVDDFVDGKATGWYNYVEVAARTVEGVHSEWTHNEWLDVRSVQSGYWEYRVDFNSMTQTNIKTKKCRKIRRVYVKADE